MPRLLAPATGGSPTPTIWRWHGAAEIAERRIGLAEDEVEEAEADLRATTALVEAGKEARLRSLQAETEVNSLRAELDTAKAQKVGAYDDWLRWRCGQQLHQPVGAAACTL
jgi:hypothetical protein